MSIKRSEFLALARIDEHTLDLWLAEEWIVPVSDEAPFTEADVARARLIHELAQDFGVNREGIGLVLHLLDQVHSLRSVIRQVKQS